MSRACAIVAALLFCAVFVHSQFPPTPIYTCTSATPLTAANFCNSVVNYPITNTININTADNTAYAQYNTTFAQINSTMANCPSALKTFICQSAFAKCDPFRQSQGVGATVCSAVAAQCGLTSFPNANTTGLTNCIANEFVSVGGTPTICAPSTRTTLGNTCRTTTTINAVSYTGAQTVIGCPAVGNCNATSLVCTRPSNLNDTCSTTADCINGQGQIGSQLTCIGGFCQYNNKRHGYNCGSPAECRSNSCVSGKCVEVAVDQACTTTTQCQKNLYCESSTGKCAQNAPGNGQCGMVYSASVIPCVQGYSCVNTTAGAVKGICQPNAQLGGACTNTTTPNTSGVLGGSLCFPTPLISNGTAVCLNNVCQLVYGNQNDVCDASRPCRMDLTCSYPAGQLVGTCTTPNNVTCTTGGLDFRCNAFQECSCTTASSAGVCSVRTNSGSYQCVAQSAAVAQCMYDKCGTTTEPFFPYDTYSCASTNCLAQMNAYYCCFSTYETSFVPPSSWNSNLCATTQAPTTTGAPTTTSSPGTTATPTTTKASGAIQNVVSIALLLIAFVFVL